MTKKSRASLLFSALVFSLGLAFAPAAFAQDKMGKDDLSKGTAKDTMSKGAAKDTMTKGTAKDTMSKDGMKKDDGMSKDSMKK
jgi:pentapeptide MXKDX repeat protein